MPRCNCFEQPLVKIPSRARNFHHLRLTARPVACGSGAYAKHQNVKSCQPISSGAPSQPYAANPALDVLAAIGAGAINAPVDPALNLHRLLSLAHLHAASCRHPKWVTGEVASPLLTVSFEQCAFD